MQIKYDEILREKDHIKNTKKELSSRKIGVLFGNRSIENKVYIEKASRNERGIFSIEDALVDLGFHYKLIDTTQKTFIETLHSVDLALVYMHGEYGEDGKIQGLLECLGMPFTGSSVQANAIGIDKVFFKNFANSLGVDTPPFVVLEPKSNKTCNLAIIEGISFDGPYMIKPRQGGSSLGIRIAVDRPELYRIIESDKLEYYDLFFIEKFIQGIMVTVGVADFTIGARTLPIVEITPKSAFYDESTKLDSETSGTEFHVPARLPSSVGTKIESIALKIHKALRCEGFSRFDFIVTPEGEPKLLEINTIPGMAKNSNLTAAFEKIGFSYDEMLLVYLKSALERKPYV